MSRRPFHNQQYSKEDVSVLTWIVGMVLASVFCLVYLATPIYLLSSVIFFLFSPTIKWPFLYAFPILVSMAFPSIPSPWLVGKLKPMLYYFQYEQIIENADKGDVIENMRKGKTYILASQPHGVISFAGICSAINSPDEFRCKFPTAAASAVLKTPILKHVMGIFQLTDASKSNLVQVLNTRPGAEGSIVLYPGGMAELFLSSRKSERLFLSKRKGFIKLALTQGVDVIPIYLFGNTSVLTVVKTGLLANLSRKLQVSLTYFWGKYRLPIPRDDKLLYVSGMPLGMPKIENPTQQDIDKWHDKYCNEVIRIFDKYKEKVPAYKHKTLIID